MLDPGKRLERAGDRLVGHADRAGSGRRRGRVLAVVDARDPGLGGKGIVRSELDATALPGNGPEPARHDRDVVGPLALEDPQLRRRVRVEAPVPVDVVGLEVRQHRDPGRERDDVFQLERGQLADDPGVVFHDAQE